MPEFVEQLVAEPCERNPPRFVCRDSIRHQCCVLVLQMFRQFIDDLGLAGRRQLQSFQPLPDFFFPLVFRHVRRPAQYVS